MPTVNASQRLQLFRDDLTALAVQEVVQKHITYGECFAFDAEAYFQLKSDIAKKFDIHPSTIVVVGSAKLGFSVVREKRYRFFGEHSDIDVALCSGSLFDSMWRNVFDYWRSGGYWDGIPDFQKYLFRGWMRPDKLPQGKSFTLAAEWWEFFRTLTSSGRFGPYKITGALYKDWHFLESYQQRCIKECQEMELGNK